MIVSNQLRFVFLGIPRTANRAMHSALLDLPGARRVGLLHNMDVPPSCRDYFTFCLVRNPYRRHLAYYLWRKMPHPWGSDAQGFTFEEYIDRCGAGDMGPNTIKEFTGELRVDEVFRYEELPVELNRLAGRLGLSQPLTLPASGRRLSRHWRSYYTESIARKVALMSRADFLDYGYPFDSWREDMPLPSRDL